MPIRISVGQKILPIILLGATEYISTCLLWNRSLERIISDSLWNGRLRAARNSGPTQFPGACGPPAAGQCAGPGFSRGPWGIVPPQPPKNRPGPPPLPPPARPRPIFWPFLGWMEGFLCLARARIGQGSAPAWQLAARSSNLGQPNNGISNMTFLKSQYNSCYEVSSCSNKHIKFHIMVFTSKNSHFKAEAASSTAYAAQNLKRKNSSAKFIR